MRVILLAVLIILSVYGLTVYFRNFETRNLYFPARQINRYPKDIGLEFEDVYFSTPDRVTINAWWVPGEKEETVLFLHGNGGNIADRLGFLEFFHGMGLNVFIIDYRGYGRSSHSPDEKGLYLDAQSAYDYLKNNYGIRDEKIVLFGASLGGAVAVELATRRKPGALILMGAFVSTGEMGRILYPKLPIGLFNRQKFDNAAKIKSVGIPKLFFHSQQDQIVPFSQGMRLYEEGDFPKEFVSLPGDHNELNEEAMGIMEKKVDEFLKKYGIR